jgi:hypothetical protein
MSFDRAVPDLFFVTRVDRATIHPGTFPTEFPIRAREMGVRNALP